MWSERAAYLLIALLAASGASAQAVPAPAPAKTKAEKTNSSTSTSAAKNKPAPVPKPAPKPPPPKPPGAVHPEDEAIVRDLELYMLYEMLNDYELFYDDDETRKTTPDKR